jgi:hypothetical protein
MWTRNSTEIMVGPFHPSAGLTDKLIDMNDIVRLSEAYEKEITEGTKRMLAAVSKIED